MMRRSLALFSTLFLTSATILSTSNVLASTLQPDPKAEALHELEKLHYQAEWKDNPVKATLNGIHDGDTLFPDLSDRAHAHRWARLASEETALKRLDLSKAPLRDQDDRDILLAALEGEKLSEAVIRPDLHQPDYAISLVTNALYGLVVRDYAPVQNRLNAAITRLTQIPTILDISARRLQNVPEIYNEIALEDLEGALTFFHYDLPTAFSSVRNPSLQQQFDQANQHAIAALETYAQKLKHLKTDGHFALGQNAIMQLLSADMIDTPPETIIALGNKRLEADRAAFLAVAREINPAHPDQALATIRQDHPAEDALISTVSQQLWDTHNFVVTHNLVTLPSVSLPEVRLTPGFERSLFSAATEWPGPFERKKLPSFYNITPPSAHFTVEQRKEILEDFNRPELLNITIHEAMPGHFVQGLYLHAHPNWSLVRRNGDSYSTTEGWAHYVEQMMVEQGFNNNNPALHLMQLQDSLLRDCRLIVSFGMHMQDMTLQQATDIMQKRCFQSPVAAYKEARRGTADPGYFSYTLGKMMILKLRDDQQKAQGNAFSLQKFHDDVLNAGLVPIKVIRREITGKEAPLL